jgi:hypothetical protein
MRRVLTGLGIIVACVVLGYTLSGIERSQRISGPPPTVDLEMDAAEITDWNWHADPNFAGRGTIKWNVSIRNKSSRYIHRVTIAFTAYDDAGKLIATTNTYVMAIPPGQIRSNSSFADLYRTEKTAEVKITGVDFAN